ncbi:MAG: polysaccharide biosynthesis tyrosine autokinase [DPANN group archaeon]|nr:polysaccharide biosynthesis tyrosine autokinase [DPANN group archaeon]
MSRIERAMDKAARIRESGERSFSMEKEVPLVHSRQLVRDIAEISIDKTSAHECIVSLTEPKSMAAEQYRQLRARILKAFDKVSPVDTIMITSSDRKEGKTVTAINLAVIMASVADYPVVLVDADLRNPSMHLYLGIEPKYGLRDYLTGDASLSAILRKTGIGSLVLLPGSMPAENPAELLSSEKMKHLVHELKAMFRGGYVIFDSSPVLLSADPLSLSRLMDSIIFIIHADVTTEKNAAQAMSLIRGCKILGVVYNDVQFMSVEKPYPRCSPHEK